ncbi:putative ABC transport system permease protein [Dyadobacter soli]|uniref:Putative ABC transport system permease protein n=1 Tax=Dyadobacter soli TaxID=659014 RepID=A0A1G7HH42_9BACT|nr:ABC transporter permease [Dyadobacter soli]SDE99646.1 putative ABC transport system permease protein [Dyadobacter soli]
MFKTFLKIAARQLWQGRLYAVINVTGLAVGTACMLFAAIYLTDERSFDWFHDNNPNLYRITSTYRERGELIASGGTGQVQGPAFQARMPEITHYARVMGGDIYGDVRHGHNAFKLQLLFVDSSFFKVFTFPLLHGDGRTALQNVNSVVITRRTALKFFNRTDVVGELLHMDADPSAMRIGKPLVVTGIAEDPPANSSVQFDILFPFEFMKVSFDDTSWLNAYLGTFVVLRPNADPGQVVRKFNRIAAALSQTQRKDHPEASVITYGLQGMTDIHLNTQAIPNQNGESGIVNTSRPVYAYIFIGIAGFILLMASINFVNIHIASSMKRAKEVGIRKATGSSKGAIIVQFLGESAILVGIAMVLAIMLVILLMPAFNQLSQKQIALTQLWSPNLMGWLVFIFVTNIACAALYPAWLISRLTPVETLYSKIRLAGRNPAGNVLMVFQFAMAVLLGIASVVFYRQMHFIRSKNLGYNPDQIVKIAIQGVRDVQQVHHRFQNELAGDPAFGAISLAGEFGNRDVVVKGQKLLANVRTVDADYLPMLEMKLTQGRNFSRAFASDKTFGVLVNEAFVKKAGISDPVGKTLMPDDYFGKQSFTILGVVGDFHFNSLKERIGPMIMPMSTHYGGGELWVKIAQNREHYAISKLESTFRKALPGAVFEYTFLHDANASAYATELRWQQIVTIATIVAVIICGLGLFGLSHLAIAQRRRETGIRVVLGATGYDIAIGFSRNFVRIIFTAILIASIAGHYLMHSWLAHFAYHTGLPWWVYAGSGAMALILALLTVFTQALRAAMADPVTVLRSE